MNIAEEISEALGDEWLPLIYRDRIRTQRTRSVAIPVPARENRPEIQYTLLGIELKVGKMRFACPDLATARYMRAFARLGCGEFAIPYDITRISSAADQLETSWQMSLIRLDDLAKDLSRQQVATLRTKLIRRIREEIEAEGPGDKMPAFDRPTRQRE